MVLSKAATITKPLELPVPPWQLWRIKRVSNSGIQLGEDLAAAGKPKEALAQFKIIAESSGDPQVRRSATARYMGAALKLGASDEALNILARYLKAQSKSPESSPAEMSLLAAYSYLHQGDYDQALAWFGLAYNAQPDGGAYANRAQKEALLTIRSLDSRVFSSASQRWALDAFVGPLFRRERIRRAQGGQRVPRDLSSFYLASNYMADTALPNSKTAIANREMPTIAPATTVAPDMNQEIVIGVLLPLSGRFAEHAVHVREGIELAVSEYQGLRQIRLEVVDTATDPLIAGKAYETLVKDKGANVVLGPLLVKTTEEVSRVSQELGVPLLTFTKRQGIPSIAPTVFRLGATTESQVKELLSYAVERLGLSSFAIAYPSTVSGEEFATAFEEELLRLGKPAALRVSYVAADEMSIDRSIQELIYGSPEAIFIPDSLENAFPLLEQLQKSDLEKVTLLGPAQWNDPVAIRGYGQLIDGAIYVAPFYVRSVAPGVVSFVERYVERFKHEPELLAAQSYDATRFVIDAFQNNGAAGRSLISVLESANTTYGVTGRLDVDQSGEISRRMSVLRLDKGNIIEVMSSGIASGNLADEPKEEEAQS
jgi:branched-chain amino acid transport system substrate-binding protein